MRIIGSREGGKREGAKVLRSRFFSLALLLSLLAGIGVYAQELSQSQYEVIVDSNVMVPMSDGTLLAVDIYRPDAPGQFPALVERTPYNKETSSEIRAAAHLYFAERGYVFLVQDNRGRFKSEGEYYPNLSNGWLEHRDGFDTVQWIAEQPWSNGEIGVVGGSQTGLSAYMLAPTQPPALDAMFVRESGMNLHEGWFYRGGAFEHGFITPWTANSFAPDVLNRNLEGEELEQALERLTAYNENREQTDLHLPLSEFPVYQGIPGLQFYYDWVTNNEYGPYWEQQDISTQHNKFEIPVYHLGGWYDIFLNGTLGNYLGIIETGATELARQNQKLVIGPWVHGPTNVGLTEVGDLVFPGADEVQYNDIRLKWFDHWLKGMDTGVMDEPPVLIYVMGDNEWRFENEWPLARAEYTNFYLHDDTSGTIDSLNDGTLSMEQPAEAENSTSYEYDPNDPIPTLGGNTLFIPSGPRNHQEADARSLTYTSDVLEEDLEVTGPITAVLYGSSSAVDTDWIVRVSEVYPDGRSINIVDGIQRARYRESSTDPTLLNPGEVYEYEIDLWATSNVFKAGNRIRVTVNSSNFPRWSRNLNTAESPELGTETVVATNTVYHDETRPSHVILPIIPR